MIAVDNQVLPLASEISLANRSNVDIGIWHGNIDKAHWTFLNRDNASIAWTYEPVCSALFGASLLARALSGSPAKK